MSLAVFNSATFITTSGLAVGAGATVEVRRESDNGLASIYSDAAGTAPITNPSAFADSSGRFTFYVVGVAGGYKIIVTKGAESYTLRNVAIGTAAQLDASDLIGADPQALYNFSLVPSVAANALTMTLKSNDGTTALSASSHATVAQRNSSLTAGTVLLRTIIANIATVISSGSTAGHASGVLSPIYWYLIDNGGTQELAWSTTNHGVKGIITTTAEGGAGAADSATLMYSTTARSSVPFRRIGRTYDSQSAAGTWTAVPTTVELEPLEIREIAQNIQSTAYTTVTADAGKHILHPTADNNARTFTIDSNANVPYPIGTAITFVNQINTVTIAITSDTMTLAGAGSTGSRSLAANGIATALKVSATGWLISGTGLS